MSDVKMAVESCETDAPDIEISDRDKNGDNIVKYLINQYGGIASIVSGVYRGLNALPPFKNNKYLAGGVKAFSFGMVGYDFYNKVKEYYNSKEEYVDDRKEDYIYSILGVDPDGDSDDDDRWLRSCAGREFNLNTEMIDWLLQAHKTEIDGITLKGYYDLENGKVLNGIPNSNFAISYGYENEDYVMEFSKTTPRLEGIEAFTMFRRLYCMSSGNMQTFIDNLKARYMDSMGFDENVIIYDGYTIHTRPRAEKINIDINNIDFKKLKHDIHRILDEKKRRGILFVGNPGTGKTTILLKLENEFTDYPIMYATAENINDDRSINRLSQFIKSMGKCIVFIEDMDALELNKKTSKIAPLLTLLDNSRNHTSVVFISTINDASLITESIARTGRFDDIIEIGEPSSNEEIYTVLKTAWTNLDGHIANFPQKMKDISWWLYFRMKRNTLTQSDYCEIAEKIHLRDQPVNNESLESAYKELMKSKKTLKKYRDKHKDDK